MELRITRSAGTNTSFVVFSSIKIGPGEIVQGAAVSGPTNHTPTLTWFGGTTSTIVTNSTTWYRSGDRMIFNLNINSLTTATATPTGLAISLPAGHTVGGNSGQRFQGALDAFALLSDRTGGILTAIQGDTAVTITVGAGVTWSTPGTGRALFGTVEFPIAEWAGSGTVNLGAGAQVEYAATSGTWDADSSTTVYGPAGQALGGTLAAARTKTVTWQYPIQADDQIVVEFSRDGTTWAPANGFRFSTAFVIQGLDSAGGEVSGVYCHNTSSTQTVVTFGRYANIANDDAPAANWPSSNAFWRVRKAKASSPVGFGLAKASESGLVAPRKGQQSLTVTSSVAFASSGTAYRAVGIYYQDQDGNHRLKFNITSVVASGSRTGTTFTITGVTFRNITDHFQAVAAFNGNATIPSMGYTSPNTNQVLIEHPTGTTGRYCVSGDVELESRPTWA